MAQITLDLPQDTNYDKLFGLFRQIGLSTVTFSFPPSTEPPQELVAQTETLQDAEEESPEEPVVQELIPQYNRPLTPPPLVAGEPQPELSAELAGVYPGEEIQSMDIEDWADAWANENGENEDSPEEGQNALDIFVRRLEQITEDDRKNVQKQIEEYKDIFNWE